MYARHARRQHMVKLVLPQALPRPHYMRRHLSLFRSLYYNQVTKGFSSFSYRILEVYVLPGVFQSIIVWNTIDHCFGFLLDSYHCCPEIQGPAFWTIIGTVNSHGPAFWTIISTVNSRRHRGRPFPPVGTCVYSFVRIVNTTAAVAAITAESELHNTFVCSFPETRVRFRRSRQIV